MRASGDDLLQRAVQGDREALSRLLEQQGPAVRASLCRQIPEDLQALLSEDDVMQETYTDAWLGIGACRAQDVHSFVDWLITTARHNLLDAIKMLRASKRGADRRQPEPATSDDDSLCALYDLVAGSATTPSRQVRKEEAKAALRAAIQRLPEDHRRVVEMYDLEERPIEEVAAALKRSPGAVFMMRARAHRRLLEMLGPASGILSSSA